MITSVLYIASFVFDAWDGAFARTYGMVTLAGDIYDHVTDVVGCSYLERYFDGLTPPYLCTQELYSLACPLES